MTDKYRMGLDRNAANHVPLSPISFLRRSAETHPTRVAVIHGETRRTYAQMAERCRRLASALVRAGLKPGDTVAMMAPNTPQAIEAHFGVPMAGCVLNMLNTRLDAAALAFILQHGEARLLLTDTEFAPVIREALHLLPDPPQVVDIEDSEGPGGERLGPQTYEELLQKGSPDYPYLLPGDEWDAIALNYTSGTTGDPKGVVYHHRGAYLNAIGEIMAFPLPHYATYLWVLPMFHCNGWCFPWAVTAIAGTQVCLRRPDGRAIFEQIARHKVTHVCGAPIIMGMMLNLPAEDRPQFDHAVSMMTAASPPPAAILKQMAEAGISVTHVYGLTEVYGPATVCEWAPEWDDLPIAEQARIKARQGVIYHTMEDMMVADPATMEPVPRDGQTMGEIFLRGNAVMKGYLKNPTTTDKSFAGGWFHTGDLAVRHPDGYVEIRDRSKDIIISGGENISTVEVEGVLYQHPDVLEAAVVARPDAKWGETPCAFLVLKPNRTATEGDIIAFCRQHLAGFKVPRTVVFKELPKTSTGKVQKYVLREWARGL